MDYTLRSYQKEGRDFIRDKKRCALFFSMGLGKTLTCLDALTPEMLPALIVAPLRVARYVWPAEIEKFNFGYTHSFIHGPKKKELLNQETDIKIINPEGLKFLFERFKSAGMPFKTVIVDESSLFRNPTSKRWKYLRGLIDSVPHRILLTGTPSPNGCHNLWGQMALLGPNAWGRYDDFLNRFFEFDYFGRPHPLPGTQKKIENDIQQIVLRKDIADEIDMPPITEQTIRFDLLPEDRETYDDIESGIDMESGEMAYTPLRCVCSGFRYREDEYAGRTTERLHAEKLFLLKQIQDDNPGEPLLVVTNFRAERQAIVSQWDCPFVDGETKTVNEIFAINQWNTGMLPMLVIHPRAMGHGVNLQTGGRMVVWYSPPDDGELYDQTNARIWRGGQEKPVVITKLIANDTIEETIDYLLRKKLLNQRNLLEALTKRDAK